MIRQTKLPNGIRVITDSSEQTQMTQIELWFCVGSQNETETQNGIAHCFEHMVFKGTPTRTAEAIDLESEDIGSDLNAGTSIERTSYEINVLQEYTEQGLSILADMVQNATFKPDELEKEKNVILQEIDTSLDMPTDVLDDCFRATVYPNQAIGRPILGTADTLKQITQADLIQFRENHYVGENLIISAAGAVEHDSFVDMCYRLFKDLPQKGNTPALAPVQYVGGDKRIERADNQINFVLGFNGFSVSDPDYKASVVLANILGGGVSSRLYQEIREKRGLVYDISAISEPLKTGGVFQISAATGINEIKELVPVMCDEILKVADTITDEEINRVRIKYLSGLYRHIANPLNHATMNAIDLIYKNRPISIEETVQKFNSVQKEDVCRAARLILSTKPTVAAVGPIQNMMSYEAIAARLGYQPTQKTSSRKASTSSRQTGCLSKSRES